MSRGRGPIAVINSVLVTLLAIGALAIAIAFWRESDLMIRFSESIVARLQAMSSLAIQEMALAIAACGLGILLVELWPRHRLAYFVSRIDGGTIDYSAALVAELLEGDLTGQDGVQNVRVGVSKQRQQVNVTVSLATMSDADPPLIASCAASRIRDRLSGLGISLGRLHVLLERAETSQTATPAPMRVVA